MEPLRFHLLMFQLFGVVLIWTLLMIGVSHTPYAWLSTLLLPTFLVFTVIVACLHCRGQFKERNE